MSGGRLVVMDRSGRDVKRYSLPDGLVTLGSDPACDIRVMLPTVCEHHATVIVRANQTVVRNVSTGNTLVNGKPISVAALQHGDTITLGDRSLRWEYDKPTSVKTVEHQPSLIVNKAAQKSRGKRKRASDTATRRLDPNVHYMLEMKHRASMPGVGKQVAIVQPQRRDTSDYHDTTPRLIVKPHRPLAQASKRQRTSKDVEKPLEKSKRKSSIPKAPTKTQDLTNPTKASLWIESRKSSPRKTINESPFVSPRKSLRNDSPILSPLRSPRKDSSFTATPQKACITFIDIVTGAEVDVIGNMSSKSITKSPKKNLKSPKTPKSAKNSPRNSARKSNTSISTIKSPTFLARSKTPKGVVNTPTDLGRKSNTPNLAKSPSFLATSKTPKNVRKSNTSAKTPSNVRKSTRASLKTPSKTKKSPAKSPSAKTSPDKPSSAIKSPTKTTHVQDSLIKTPTTNKSPTKTPTTEKSPTKTPTGKKSPAKTPTTKNSPTKTPTAKKSLAKTPTSIKSPTKTPANKKSPAKTPNTKNSPTKTPTTKKSPTKTPATKNSPAKTPTTKKSPTKSPTTKSPVQSPRNSRNSTRHSVSPVKTPSAKTPTKRPLSNKNTPSSEARPAKAPRISRSPKHDNSVNTSKKSIARSTLSADFSFNATESPKSPQSVRNSSRCSESPRKTPNAKQSPKKTPNSTKRISQRVSSPVKSPNSPRINASPLKTPLSAGKINESLSSTISINKSSSRTPKTSKTPIKASVSPRNSSRFSSSFDNTLQTARNSLRETSSLSKRNSSRSSTTSVKTPQSTRNSLSSYLSPLNITGTAKIAKKSNSPSYTPQSKARHSKTPKSTRSTPKSTSLIKSPNARQSGVGVSEVKTQSANKSLRKSSISARNSLRRGESLVEIESANNSLRKSPLSAKKSPLSYRNSRSATSSPVKSPESASRTLNETSQLGSSINSTLSPKSFRKSTRSSLQAVEEAIIETETRSRKSTLKLTPNISKTIMSRRGFSAKKITPLRTVVLRKAVTPNLRFVPTQTVKKVTPKVTKIQAPSTIDYTKQAALMLIHQTGHTPKSKLLSPKESSAKKGVEVMVTPKGSLVPLEKAISARKSGRQSSLKKTSGISKRSTLNSTRSTRASKNSLIVLDISESDFYVSRSRNSTLHSKPTSPLLPSPRKSALKDPSAKKSSRKNESIKFDLSNLESFQNESIDVLVDSKRSSRSSTSDSEITLRYSDTSQTPSIIPSPRRSIHSRSSKILEKSLGPNVEAPRLSRSRTSEPPSPRKSGRASLMVQQVLQNSQNNSKLLKSKSLSDSTLSNATRTLTPKLSRSKMESYSIVDLVSVDSNDTQSSLYNSIASTSFGTPQTGRRTRSTIEPNLLGTSTPFVKASNHSNITNLSKRSSKRDSSQNETANSIVSLPKRSKSLSVLDAKKSPKRSSSLATPKRASQFISSSARTSRSTSGNDSDLLILSLSGDSKRNSRSSLQKSTSSIKSQKQSSKKLTKSPKQSIASSRSSRRSENFSSPASNGLHTPENRHSPEEVGTPMLSIKSLLESSNSSVMSIRSRKSKQSINIKKKSIGSILPHSESRKGRSSKKSKSLNLSAGKKSLLRLSKDSSNASDKTDENAPKPSNDDTITPKSTVKLVQETVKEKHSTAKKPQSKRSIIDNLNDSDIVKQLFNSPVKRKLSQSMTEFGKTQLKNVASAKRTRNTIALTNKTLEQTLLDNSSSISPEEFVSPLVTPSNSPNLTGVKRLFGKQTPKNDLSNVRGVKKIVRTPRVRKSIKNDLRNVSGVKKVFAKQPRNSLSDVAVKNLLTSSPVNDLRRVSGVKTLFQLRGVPTSPKNDLTNVSGVRSMYKAKSPKNDIRNVSGVKKVLSRNSPKNNLSDVRGVKRLFTREKSKGGLSDVSGVEELFDTSFVSDKSNKSNSELLFDELVGKPPIKATYSKSMLSKSITKPKKSHRKSHVSVSLITNNVEKWLEEELQKRARKSISKTVKELQNLATETVEGKSPLTKSRVRNSTLTKTVVEENPKKSTSQIYSARKLPIKKRSLIEKLSDKSANNISNLPIKKRVLVHSTPVKSGWNLTVDASTLGRVSPIAAENTVFNIDSESSTRSTRLIVSPKTKTIKKPASAKKPKTQPKKASISKQAQSDVNDVTEQKKSTRASKQKASTVIKASPKPKRGKASNQIEHVKDKSVAEVPSSPKKRNTRAKPASPVKGRSTRGKKATDTTTKLPETKKRRPSLVITKKAPILSPKPVTPRKSRNNQRKEAKPVTPLKKTTRGRRNVDGKPTTPKPQTPKTRVKQTKNASIVIVKPSPKLKPQAKKDATKDDKNKTQAKSKRGQKQQEVSLVVETKSSRSKKVSEVKEVVTRRGRNTKADISKEKTDTKVVETKGRKRKSEVESKRPTKVQKLDVSKVITPKATRGRRNALTVESPKPIKGKSPVAKRGKEKASSKAADVSESVNVRAKRNAKVSPKKQEVKTVKKAVPEAKTTRNTKTETVANSRKRKNDPEPISTKKDASKKGNKNNPKKSASPVKTVRSSRRQNTETKDVSKKVTFKKTVTKKSLSPVKPVRSTRGKVADVKASTTRSKRR